MGFSAMNSLVILVMVKILHDLKKNICGHAGFRLSTA